MLCIAAALLAAIGYWLRTPDTVLTIESDLPGAEVYAGPEFLGTAPLHFSSREIGNLRGGEPPPLTNDTAWARARSAGVLIKHPHGPGVLVWIKAPKEDLDEFTTHETPWGRAACGELWLAQSGQVTFHAAKLRRGTQRIRGRTVVPATIGHDAQTVRVRFEVRNESAKEWVPPRDTVTARIHVGSFLSVQHVTYWREMELPAESLPPGEQWVLECDIPVPNIPGDYALNAWFQNVDLSVFDASGPRFLTVVLRVK